MRKREMGHRGSIWLILLAFFSLLTLPVLGDSFQKISFKALGKFDCGGENPYEKPSDKDCPIPENVQALNGQKISIEGYMIPLEGDEKGRIKSFVLVQDQMSCCFGGSPKLNAWIFVEMIPQKFAEYLDYEPIVVSGKFEVGFTKLKGQVLSLYRMQGEKVSKS